MIVLINCIRLLNVVDINELKRLKVVMTLVWRFVAEGSKCELMNSDDPNDKRVSLTLARDSRQKLANA
jgi:hypothetical protein